MRTFTISEQQLTTLAPELHDVLAVRPGSIEQVPVLAIATRSLARRRFALLNEFRSALSESTESVDLSEKIVDALHEQGLHEVATITIELPLGYVPAHRNPDFEKLFSPPTKEKEDTAAPAGDGDKPPTFKCPYCGKTLIVTL
jgi:hypothetical protein